MRAQRPMRPPAAPRRPPRPHTPHPGFYAAPPGPLAGVGFWQRPLAHRPRHRGHAVGLGGVCVAATGVQPRAAGGLIALSLPIGWWACTITARNLGRDDPGCIVWDEVVAMWLILWLLAPASWHGQLLAFALFRLFDAAKPHPVRWADQCFKGSGWRGGWGIMFDDLVAAFCTLLVLAAGRHFGLW